MKSFNQFISEKRSDEIEKLRQQLQNTPFLTDDEMRAQNPQATAAYEKEVARQKIKTPEKGVTIEVGGSGKSAEGLVPVRTRGGKTIYVSPEEAFSRAEQGTKKSQKYNKPVTKPEATQNISLNRQPAPKPNVGSPLTVSTQNIPLNRQPAPKPNVGSPLTVSTPKPAAVKPAAVKPALVGASTNNAAKELEKVSGKIIKQMRADRTASAVKAVRNLGRASTVLGATLDFQSAFQKAKQSDAGQRRAIGAGIAAAGGGLAGAATGARIGGLVGGLPGSIVGGVLGYTGGVKKAGQIYRGVVGKPGEQVTSQSVLKNIKKVYRQEVPTSIRQVVPKEVKKGFTNFYNQAVGAAKNLKKSYDAYNATQK